MAINLPQMLRSMLIVLLCRYFLPTWTTGMCLMGTCLYWLLGIVKLSPSIPSFWVIIPLIRARWWRWSRIARFWSSVPGCHVGQRLRYVCGTISRNWHPDVKFKFLLAMISCVKTLIIISKTKNNIMVSVTFAPLARIK